MCLGVEWQKVDAWEEYKLEVVAAVQSVCCFVRAHASHLFGSRKRKKSSEEEDGRDLLSRENFITGFLN